MYDVIVIGLGGMGSAAAYHLAARGKRVLGLEQFGVTHDRGSSHGESRVIRQAYFEDAAYVPLLLRAYELWDQLERETDTHLLTITGGLMIGAPESSVFAGSLASAEAHGLAHEVFDAEEIRRRYPPLRPEPGVVALYETMAGFLHPEQCIRAHVQRAEAMGASLHFEEPVVAWSASGRGVSVTTERATYEAERLILAAGPWMPQLLDGLGLPLTVERNVLYWFDPIGGIDPFRAERFPIYIWELNSGVHFYGFPAVEKGPGGVKVAFFYRGAECTPNTIDRHVSDREVAAIRDVLADRIPALDAPLLSAATCMYTTTPDHDFIVGLHPSHDNVVIASPCSGHGYKFASVIGEVLADLATEGRTRHDIGMFDVNRFRDQ
jgi:sarcosine oxidase